MRIVTEKTGSSENTEIQDPTLLTTHVKRHQFLSLVVLVSVVTGSLGAQDSLRIEGVHCEYLTNPMGIDARKPRLSWTMTSSQRGQKQTCYRVLVATSPQQLEAGIGDLWDSGKVASDQSVNLLYDGRELQSAMRCWWKVRVWNTDDKPGPWSSAAWWEMGLMAPEDWRADWIRAPDSLDPSTEPVPAPLLRTTFHLDKAVARARLYVSGLGYGEFFLNGAKVGDHVLSPAFTRYDKRIYYQTFDVTEALCQGANAVGAMLGNGWYNQHVRDVWLFHRAPWRGRARLLCQLEIVFQDGSTRVITSGSGWRVAHGPIRFDSVRNGETYDARHEKPGWTTPVYDDSGWQAAALAEPPGGKLEPQTMPPTRVTETIPPKRISQLADGRHVVDLGQNISGWVRLRVSGPRGTEVKLRYGERLNDDGTVSQEYIDKHVKTGEFQTDRYILSGQGTEIWEPRFTYHGFRYVEMAGYPADLTPDDICGRVVHTDFKAAGQFRCSSELVNRIVECASWSYRTNFEGRPTDCPHREKNGWSGDAVIAAEQAMYNWDNVAAYEKWLGSFRDVQRPCGQLPVIIPTGRWGYDFHGEVHPARDAALLVIPWYLYQYCADRRVLEENYESMKAYVEFCGHRASGHIVEEGIGDHCPAGPATATALTSTAFYYHCVDLLARIARVLGQEADAQRYGILAVEIKRAYHSTFFRGNGQYGEGTQTAQACSLGLGLCPESERTSVLERLVENVQANGGHLATGNLGTKFLFRSLSRNGHAELAYDVATCRSYPGYGYWIEQGATTLWERWSDDSPSLNHVRWSDIVAWFYQELAGLRTDAEQPGFKHFTIKPHLLGDLTWVDAWHDSVYGKVQISWKRGARRLTLSVQVPVNTSATIHVPAMCRESVTLSGQPPEKTGSVGFLRMEDGRALYEVGSGNYEFVSMLVGG